MLEITLFPPETAEQYIDLERYVTQSIVDSIGSSSCEEVRVKALGYTAIVNNVRIEDPTLTPFWKSTQLRFSAVSRGRAYVADLYVSGTDIETRIPKFINTPWQDVKSICSSMADEFNGGPFGDDVTCAIGAFNRFTGPRGEPIYARLPERTNSSHAMSTALRDGMTDYAFLCAKNLIARLYRDMKLDRDTRTFVKTTTAGSVHRSGIPRIVHIDASKHAQGKIGTYSVHSTHSARDATSPIVRPVTSLTLLDIKPNDVVVMVNSDFYYEREEMEYLMSRCICLFVTIQPQAPSGVYGGNGSFTMYKGVLHANVMGGASYAHRIWDYNHSHIIVSANSWYDRLVTVETSRVPIDWCQHSAIVATFPGELVRKASCCCGKRITGNTLERYRTSVIGERGHTADAIVFNGTNSAEHPLVGRELHMARKVIGITPRSPNLSTVNLNNDAVFVTLDNVAVTIEAYRRKSEAERAKDPASMVADTFEPAHISRRRTATYLYHSVSTLPYIDVTVVSPNSRVIKVLPGTRPVMAWIPRNFQVPHQTAAYPLRLNFPYVEQYHPECLSIEDAPWVPKPTTAPQPTAGRSRPLPEARLRVEYTTECGCVHPSCRGECGQRSVFAAIEITESQQDDDESSVSDTGTVVACPCAQRRIVSDVVPETDNECFPIVMGSSDVVLPSVPQNGASCLMDDNGETYRNTIRVHPPLVKVPSVFPGTSNEELRTTAWVRFKKKAKPQTKDPSRTAWYLRMAKMFGSRCARFLGSTVSAYPIETVDEKMDKKTQREATKDPIYNQLASVPGETIKLKAFMKNEQVPPDKPARLIICRDPISDPMRHGEARWALPLMDAFKKLPWYAGGKPPQEIDQEVLRCAENMDDHLLPSDFSKFDASQQALIKKCFVDGVECMVTPDERADFKEVHASIGRAPCNEMKGTPISGKSANGVVNFRVREEMTSGRNFTTFENSFKQTFSAYCALIKQYQAEHGGVGGNAAHEWAWSKLGVYMGDDGITIDLKIKYMQEVCDDLGLVLTAEEIPLDSDRPIPFLGRLYPSLHKGDSSNFYDIRRFLTKAGNFSESNLAEAHNSLILYAKGMAITDPKTPVIREYCELVFRSFTKERIERQTLDDLDRYKGGAMSNWLYHTLKWGGDGRPSPTEQAVEDFLLGMAAMDVETDQICRLQTLLKAAVSIETLTVPEGVAVDLGNAKFSRNTVVGTSEGPRLYYAGEEYY